jgi:hypothetical protein
MAARNQALKTAAVFRRKGLTAKVRDAEAAAEIAGRTVTALVKVERVTGDDVRKILAMGDAPC